MKVEKYLDQIERYIPLHEKSNKSVSQVNVGWQLDHCLNVIIKVSKAIKDSDPSNYQAKFHLTYEVLNVLFWLPRGKGRSPKSVLPDEQITQESLEEKLKQARLLLKQLPSLTDKKYFEHPLFGDLKKERAIRFLGLHTHHHLKIVRDILGQ
ncbi:MAG: DUF1569 domain-containing protein [Vicingaceae bacterium]